MKKLLPWYNLKEIQKKLLNCPTNFWNAWLVFPALLRSYLSRLHFRKDVSLYILRLYKKCRWNPPTNCSWPSLLIRPRLHCYWTWMRYTGLQNSDSSKGQIININLPPVAKVYFISCKDFVVVWEKFWNDNYLFEVGPLQHFMQLRELSQAGRKAFVGRMRTAGHMLGRLALLYSSTQRMANCNTLAWVSLIGTNRLHVYGRFALTMWLVGYIFALNAFSCLHYFACFSSVTCFCEGSVSFSFSSTIFRLSFLSSCYDLFPWPCFRATLIFLCVYSWLMLPLCALESYAWIKAINCTGLTFIFPDHSVS